jgi:F0F1-type ATP synthase assembly protein I
MFSQSGNSRPNTTIAQALRLLRWQFGWMVISGVAACLLLGQRWAWSMATGAGIGLIATSYLVFVMVKHSLTVTKPATLFTLLLTWLIKTILVIVLLLIALRSPALLPLAVILGLSGGLGVYWLSLIVSR